jgi:hypothetical protein
MARATKKWILDFIHSFEYQQCVKYLLSSTNLQILSLRIKYYKILKNPPPTLIFEKSLQLINMSIQLISWRLKRLQMSIQLMSWRLKLVSWRLKLIVWRLQLIEMNLQLIGWRLKLMQMSLQLMSWILILISWRLILVGSKKIAPAFIINTGAIGRS